MTIEPFRRDDVEEFLTLAAAEKWVTGVWEFEFLLTEFPQGCFAARGENGETIGFVTSLRHERSGWIGNLIVNPEYRGNGIGELLFRKAMDSLCNNDVETVWLTASQAGMPLYQKLGYSRIDTIVRWSGCGRLRGTNQTTEATGATDYTLLNDIDSRAWGDRRDALVAETAGRGAVFQEESGFVVLQQYGNRRQLGPFSASDYRTADTLLKTALNSIPCETEVFLDSPASNRTALMLFNRNRMRISGSNELMYAGVKPNYQPHAIYGLATMGSCG
jgi:GNAT superfamily N-acetyltransferase